MAAGEDLRQGELCRFQRQGGLKLLGVKLIENDVKGNENCFELTEGLRY